MQRTWIAITACTVGFCWLGESSSAQERRRERWDAASFLQRLDRNGNSILEPDEMVGRAKGFVENLGIDASGAVPIETIMNAINREREQADQEREKKEAERAASADWSSPRLVPGFGETADAVSVPGFGEGATSPGGASTSSTQPVSESVNAQVDRVLGQYDENKDQVLDANEIQKTPWGAPSPQESDTNGDGRLTRAELIERYRRREADSARMNGERDQQATQESNDSRRERRSRDASRREGSTPSASTSDRATTAKPEPSTSKRSTSNENRIADYVQDLMQQYDSDRNGSLDADEQSKMKSSPKNADSDSNGVLSRDELVSYYGGGYRSSSSSSGNGGEGENAKPSSQDNTSGERESRRESRRRESSAGSSSNFDGQRPVKMHEFTDEWTEEKLEEFYRLDVNHDGVISVEEFRSRR